VSKKSINALISFALMMLVLGLYYISIDEKLLGLFQIFIYTGGIAVLMLFGITLIGVSFPHAKPNPWTAVVGVLFFIVISVLFLTNSSHLVVHSVDIVEKKELFASSFSEVVIIFALIASSLLYGTIKMIKVLKPSRSKDV
jgi:NADH-quinone oxidoreductase subunit J